MVRTYLVECYGADGTPAAYRDRAARALSAARELRATGHVIEVLGCTLVPGDETAFWRFASDSLAAVETVGERAQLAGDRVSETVELAANGTLLHTDVEQAADGEK